MKRHTLILLNFIVPIFLFTQINFTAHDNIPAYQGGFHYGSNLGNYPPWTNAEVGNIAAGNTNLNLEGIGVENFRVSLPESFVEQWGYDIRVNDFEHWKSLGMNDHLMMVGWPSDAHRDMTQYCNGSPSELFLNMYEPIWDGGANGTPINENNYYANYLYKVVNIYKDYIKFYEVWNEPDFALSPNAWLPPGQPNNWWDNNPNPCDFSLQAPIFHYIRLLRITYEVIKSIDPTAYICTGGIGNPAFLDAILRNTDNPNNGSVNNDYPLAGGAYFDVLSYHSYPHFDGSMWEFPPTGGLNYFRHSDKGIDGMLARQSAFRQVLNNYNYGGIYPEKLWILSETMLPREAFNNYIGSVEAQRNYLLKALVEAQRNDLLQVDIFSLAETESASYNWNEYFYMGLFKNLSAVDIYQHQPTEAGIAFETINTILDDNVTYDAGLTNQMNLSAGVRGAAFKKGNEAIFVLWAATSIDQSEEANAVYSFPASFAFEEVELRAWDFALNEGVDVIAATNIPLTSTPIFIEEADAVGVPPTANFTVSQNEDCVPFMVQFTDVSLGNPTAWNWSFEGGTIATSTEQSPTVTYFQSGTYGVTLTVSNDLGDNTTILTNAVVATDVPVTDYDYTINEFTVSFTNNSLNADSFLWNFGDGETSTEVNPTHQFSQNDTYTIQLTAFNECGEALFTEDLFIDVNDVTNLESIANVSIAPNPNNGRFSLIFTSQSTDDLNLQVYDLLGRNVYVDQWKLTNGAFERPIDLTFLNSGLYILQLNIESEQGYFKVMID